MTFDTLPIGLFWLQLRQFARQLGLLLHAIWQGNLWIDNKGVLHANNYEMPARPVFEDSAIADTEQSS